MTIELLAPAPEILLGIASYPPSEDRTAVRAQEREAIRRLLSELLQVETPPERAHRADGSPYLPDYPGYALSLSHTRGQVALLLAPATRRVGVDIERYRDQLLTVAPRYIAPEEWELVTSSPAYPEETLRTLLWTAKETAYKIARPAHGSLLGFRLEQLDTAGQTMTLSTTDSADRLTLHYLFRPPFVLSFGVLSPGLG